MYVYVWKRHDGTPFYVGATISATRANPRNSGNRNWLCKQELDRLGKNNVVLELHHAETRELAAEIERTLILQYGRIQLGTGTLTNLRSGGEGMQTMTPEGRAATSKRMRENNPTKKPGVREKIAARMSDSDVRIKFLGNNNASKRPEVRAKLLAKWQDPEYKERQSIARLGKPIHTDVHKEVMRERLLDPNNPMREYHKVLNSDPAIRAKRTAALQSPEVRAKISATLNDPEKKAARLVKLNATIATPEYQAKLALRRKPKLVRMNKEELFVYRSNLMKERNNNPEYQTKRVEKLKAASDKISQGVLKSMGARLTTMQTAEVQAKLRAPKTIEHRLKISLAKKGVPRSVRIA